MEIEFTEDSYRSIEGDFEQVFVRVAKRARIASPLTVMVTPLTLTQHRATGRAVPPGLPTDSTFSPIEASM